MAGHRRFTLVTDIQVYFCDPYHLWQRGSNENTNGLLRSYFAKSVDLSGVTQAKLNTVERTAQRNVRLRNTNRTISTSCCIERLRPPSTSDDISLRERALRPNSAMR